MVHGTRGAPGGGHYFAASTCRLPFASAPATVDAGSFGMTRGGWFGGEGCPSLGAGLPPFKSDVIVGVPFSRGRVVWLPRRW
jgi:hypothetical protein